MKALAEMLYAVAVEALAEARLCDAERRESAARRGPRLADKRRECVGRFLGKKGVFVARPTRAL